jgi:hypothetical protein
MSGEKETCSPFLCGCDKKCRIVYVPHDQDPISVVEHRHCDRAGSRLVPGTPIKWEEKDGTGWKTIEEWKTTGRKAS